MDNKKKSFIVNSLRRATYKWPSRWAAEKRTHLARNQYLCESCGGIFPKRETEMDHIVPVVDPLVGWQGFSDEFMDRLFCDENGLQRLCVSCHDKKTGRENLLRSETKKVAREKARKKKK